MVHQIQGNKKEKESYKIFFFSVTKFNLRKIIRIYIENHNKLLIHNEIQN